MSEYKTVETTYEVWKAIKAAHAANLVVFASFTDLDDGYCATNKVFTSYGFYHADFPLMEAYSSWENDSYRPNLRNNEQHKYYLCLPSKQED